MGEARTGGRKRGAREAAGSGFRSRPSCLLQTTKFLPPYATPLPTSPSRASRTGTSRPLSFLLPPGAPRQGTARPGRAASSLGGGRRASSGGRGLSGMAARRPAWRSRTCILPSCHRGEPLRAPHLQSSPGGGGRGLQVETLHTGVPFGYCGAGRSCPFSTYRAIASPNAKPPPNIGRAASLSPCTSGPLDPVTEWWRKPPTRSASSPLPLSPLGLGYS